MTDPAVVSPGESERGERGELRAVLDTNVPIAAHLSRNPRSPTDELLKRWRSGQFTQLYSDDMLMELIEKFQARKIPPEASDRYLADLITLGEFVVVAPEQAPPNHRGRSRRQRNPGLRLRWPGQSHRDLRSTFQRSGRRLSRHPDPGWPALPLRRARGSAAGLIS